ncbi:hypothetical protein VNO77_04910 [Canavalia gladiata]|uniref:Uncharacterized protein n=1 Tax=Canavalia gladiata TaxID=3824 RepID=A0AAN9N2F8_CANGL
MRGISIINFLRVKFGAKGKVLLRRNDYKLGFGPVVDIWYGSLACPIKLVWLYSMVPAGGNQIMKLVGYLPIMPKRVSKQVSLSSSSYQCFGCGSRRCNTVMEAVDCDSEENGYGEKSLWRFR